MKSVAAIATIIGVASGTSLRAHAGAAVDNAAVEQLAAKYDCHDAAGDILVTVNNIIEANAAEKERLTTDCQKKITNHQSAWHTAETTYTTEINKVTPEETKIEEDEIAARNSKFSDEKLKFCVPDVKDSDQTSSGFRDTSCGTTYGTEIRDIRHAKDSADDKGSQAVSLHAEKKVRTKLLSRPPDRKSNDLRQLLVKKRPQHTHRRQPLMMSGSSTIMELR